MNERFLFKSIILYAAILFAIQIKFVWAEPPSSGLHWPLPDRPKKISGTLGEYRGGTLHGGIDFPTGGLIGMPVMAIDSGYVYRVAFYRWSIGNVVWLKHADGRLSKYGHLSRFSTKIANHPELANVNNKIVLRQEFNVYISAQAILVNKGEIIAYSGDTGIGPAHLHMEYLQGDTRLDFLQYSDYVDIKAPVIVNVEMIPLALDSRINGLYQALTLPLEKGYSSGPHDLGGGSQSYRQHYALRQQQAIKIHGKIGFKVTTHDQSEHSARTSPYAVSFLANGSERYRFAIDKLDPSPYYSLCYLYDIHNTSIAYNSHYTFFLYQRSLNNPLPFIQSYQRGILDARKGESVKVRIEVLDQRMNLAYFEENLIIDKTEYKPVNILPNNVNADLATILKSPDQKMTLTIAKNSLVVDKRLDIKQQALRLRLPDQIKQLSPVYFIEPAGFREFLKPFTIKLRHADQAKTHIYFFSADNAALLELVEQDKIIWAGSIGGSPKNGLYQSSVRKTGAFFIAQDNSPPTWGASSLVDQQSYRIDKIRIDVEPRDVGSGLDMDSLVVFVDGKACLVDRDPDKKSVEVFYPPSIFHLGEHTLRATVKDRAGNSSKPLLIRYKVKPD